MSTATLDRPQGASLSDMPVTDRKRCITCEASKPTGDFDKVFRTRPELRRNECKSCRIERARRERGTRKANLVRRQNARIRRVFAANPQTADAARVLGVSHRKAAGWQLALAENPDVELRVWGPIDMGAEPPTEPVPEPDPTADTPPPPPLERPFPGWQFHAACRKKDTDMWYGGPDRPDQERKGAPPRVNNAYAAHAKSICAVCPVKAMCLAEAMARNEEHGIWGGLDRKERQALTTPDSTPNAGQ
ncbi:WhiB family transcriptional regulator [Embleya sp. NPDC005971]|uniref:WhiB family transcriptional regulator n=1 Tax=Embleya sp. NPDC005971 TaxID=3156724 RepID=UPI0033C6F67D